MRPPLAFVIGALLGVAILLVFGFVDRRAELLRETDFSGFWAGARVLVEGGDPYDAATWRAATERLGTQVPDTAVYGYPPHVAVALVPLALLPLEVAAAIWAVGGMALAALALGALVRRCVPTLPAAQALVGLALFASQPALTSFVIGQWTFLLVAATASAARLALAGRTLAALPAAVLFAKPQLALVAPIAFALPLPRRARYAAALAAVAALAAIAGWIARPGWIEAWLAAVPPQRVGALPRNATTFGAAVDVFGASGLWLAAIVVVAAALPLLRFRTRPQAACAAMLAYGAVVAPYSWAYDQLLLLVPAVLAAGEVGRRGAFRLVAAVSGVLLAISPLFYVLAVTRGRESLSGIVPLVIYLVLLGVLWRARDGTPPTGEAAPAPSASPNQRVAS